MDQEQIEYYESEIIKFARLLDLSLAEMEKYTETPDVAADLLFSRASNYTAACNILRTSEALCYEKIQDILHSCSLILQGAAHIMLLRGSAVNRRDHEGELVLAAKGAREIINENELQTREDIKQIFGWPEEQLNIQGLSRICICAGMWRAALTMLMNEPHTSLVRNLIRDQTRLLFNIANKLENGE